MIKAEELKVESGYYLVIGVRNFQTKAGKSVQNIYVANNFSEYDLENSDACYGLQVRSEYSSKRYDLKPGDVVKLEYEPGFEGRAQLVNITKK